MLRQQSDRKVLRHQFLPILLRCHLGVFQHTGIDCPKIIRGNVIGDKTVIVAKKQENFCSAGFCKIQPGQLTLNLV